MANFVDVSTDTKTIAGEALEYPSTPNPVISSNVVTIPPGTVTPWMVHPVQCYIYVLEGVLTRVRRRRIAPQIQCGPGANEDPLASGPQRRHDSGQFPWRLHRREGRADNAAPTQRQACTGIAARP
jgi:hypothetical protein